MISSTFKKDQTKQLIETFCTIPRKKKKKLTYISLIDSQIIIKEII